MNANKMNALAYIESLKSIPGLQKYSRFLFNPDTYRNFDFDNYPNNDLDYHEKVFNNWELCQNIEEEILVDLDNENDHFIEGVNESSSSSHNNLKNDRSSHTNAVIDKNVLPSLQDDAVINIDDSASEEEEISGGVHESPRSSHTNAVNTDYLSTNSQDTDVISIGSSDDSNAEKKEYCLTQWFPVMLGGMCRLLGVTASISEPIVTGAIIDVLEDGEVASTVECNFRLDGTMTIPPELTKFCESEPDLARQWNAEDWLPYVMHMNRKLSISSGGEKATFEFVRYCMLASSYSGDDGLMENLVAQKFPEDYQEISRDLMKVLQRIVKKYKWQPIMRTILNRCGLKDREIPAFNYKHEKPDWTSNDRMDNVGEYKTDFVPRDMLNSTMANDKSEHLLMWSVWWNSDTSQFVVSGLKKGGNDEPLQWLPVRFVRNVGVDTLVNGDLRLCGPMYRAAVEASVGNRPLCNLCYIELALEHFQDGLPSEWRSLVLLMHALSIIPDLKLTPSTIDTYDFEEKSSRPMASMLSGVIIGSRSPSIDSSNTDKDSDVIRRLSIYVKKAPRESDKPNTVNDQVELRIEQDSPENQPTVSNGKPQTKVKKPTLKQTTKTTIKETKNPHLSTYVEESDKPNTVNDQVELRNEQVSPEIQPTVSNGKPQTKVKKPTLRQATKKTIKETKNPRLSTNLEEVPLESDKPNTVNDHVELRIEQDSPENQPTVSNGKPQTKVKKPTLNQTTKTTIKETKNNKAEEGELTKKPKKRKNYYVKKSKPLKEPKEVKKSMKPINNSLDYNKLTQNNTDDLGREETTSIIELPNTTNSKKSHDNNASKTNSHKKKESENGNQIHIDDISTVDLDQDVELDALSFHKRIETSNVPNENQHINQSLNADPRPVGVAELAETGMRKITNEVSMNGPQNENPAHIVDNCTTEIDNTDDIFKLPKKLPDLKNKSGKKKTATKRAATKNDGDVSAETLPKKSRNLSRVNSMYHKSSAFVQENNILRVYPVHEKDKSFYSSNSINVTRVMPKSSFNLIYSEKINKPGYVYFEESNILATSTVDFREPFDIDLNVENLHFFYQSSNGLLINLSQIKKSRSGRIQAPREDRLASVKFVVKENNSQIELQLGGTADVVITVL